MGSLSEKTVIEVFNITTALELEILDELLIVLDSSS